MKKITLLICMVLPFVSIAQNTCAEAGTVTTAAVYTVDLVDGPEIPPANCSVEQDDTTAAEWYVFTASIDGIGTVSSDLPQNEGGDTRVYIFTGSCDDLQCYAFDDDADFDNGNYLSTVEFVISAGTSYYIAWDDYWSDEGFDFTVEETTIDCTTAIPYETTFDDWSNFAICSTTFDVDGNGISWAQQFTDIDNDGIDESFVTNGTNSDLPKNDWLFSPAFTLTGGETYELTYTFNGANLATDEQPILANETLTSFVTNAASPTAEFQQQIATNMAISQQGEEDTLHENLYTQAGSFTAPADGEYYIAFNSTSPANSAFLLLFSFTLAESLATPSFETNKARIFPNPVADELAIISQTAIDSVEIFNLMGQKVATNTFNDNEARIDVSGLSSGAYTVKILSGSNTQVSKIIKQ